MFDRSALGVADVPDDVLAAMVAEQLGATEVGEVSGSVEPVAYDLPALTTGGRYWVRGQALADGSVRPFAFFVKHVHSWQRSPFFAAVPESFREAAAAMIPWRTEHLAYRSDLADRLPQGLSMPRTYGVFDVDDLAASIWLEALDVVPATWDEIRFGRAAEALGRLAASDRVTPLRDVGRFGWTVESYLHGRLAHQVLPTLRSEEIWRHPLVAGAFDVDLRDRLLAAADRVEAYAQEFAALPTANSHGDACPNNLLEVRGREGLVLIDYGFWGPQPFGHDLGQLLVGDIQIGRRRAHGLDALDRVLLEGYRRGLQAEGASVAPAVVARGHALQLLLFTGLSALPVEHLAAEHLAAEPDPVLRDLVGDRAAVARFCLDRLDATAAP